MSGRAGGGGGGGGLQGRFPLTNVCKTFTDTLWSNIFIRFGRAVLASLLIVRRFFRAVSMDVYLLVVIKT